MEICRFRPPDACYVELLRFRVRPPKNRELPLQVRSTFSVSGNKIELRSDVLVPGYISRKYGQIPCEDVAIRFPLPEAWIYMFRVEKHFRYGSVKSAHRRYFYHLQQFNLRVSTLNSFLSYQLVSSRNIKTNEYQWLIATVQLFGTCYVYLSLLYKADMLCRSLQKP